MSDDSRPAPGGDTLPVEVPMAPASGRHWSLFAALALTIVVVDQLAKLLVTRALDPGQSVDVVGNVVRIVFGQNTGALFGLFKDNAVMFGVVSIVVVGLIVAYHARSAPSLYLTLTLGCLLGGAIGNMLDRLRLGYVVDFVDAGIGSTRFYTFNVADSAITLAILLLVVAAVRPSLIDGGSRASRSPAPEPATPSPPPTTNDAWGDGLEPDDRPPVGDRSR